MRERMRWLVTTVVALTFVFGLSNCAEKKSDNSGMMAVLALVALPPGGDDALVPECGFNTARKIAVATYAKTTTLWLGSISSALGRPFLAGCSATLFTFNQAVGNPNMPADVEVLDAYTNVSEGPAAGLIKSEALTVTDPALTGGSFSGTGSYSYGHELGFLTSMTRFCVRDFAQSFNVNITYSGNNLVKSAISVPDSCFKDGAQSYDWVIDLEYDNEGLAAEAPSKQIDTLTFADGTVDTSTISFESFTVDTANFRLDDLTQTITASGDNVPAVSTVTETFTFSYGSDGEVSTLKIARVGDVPGNIPANETITFGYDSAGRTTTIKEDTSSYSFAFEYDGDGNMTKATTPPLFGDPNIANDAQVFAFSYE